MGTQEINPPATQVARALRLTGLLAVLLAAAGHLSAQVPEPETIFYGRIINRSSGQEYQLRDGTISWKVSGGGGAPLNVSAPIESLQGGAYSYKLKVPHQAKSLGLVVDGSSLPLQSGDAEFENGSILVNGEPAVPLNGSLGFTASQPNRGNVHRLDLEVFHALDDSDFDGIPDWWEDLYGLDKQWAGDAAQHFGDNRYSYLQAFHLGLDPRSDDRLPQLLTNEVTVVSQGATGLLLRAVASTTAPAQLVYRLLVPPPGGSVVQRNARPDPSSSSRRLKAGDKFTQADVDAGLIEFVHADPAVLASSLKLEIASLNRPDQPVTRDVGVIVYRPDPTEGRAGVLWANDDATAATPRGTALERWKARATTSFAEDWAGGSRQKNEIGAFLLARWFSYTVWDGRIELPSRNLAVPSAGLKPAEYTAFLRQYGKARNHVIFAGDGSVRIDGGMGSDILVAGKSSTTLRGNLGGDIFVAGRGRTFIEDFNKAQGDVLDLSDLLLGVPGALAERVEPTSSAGGTLLRIPLGDSSAALITLNGVKLLKTDLEPWRRSGSIFTGDLSGVQAPQNHPPVATADAGYVTNGQPVTIAVLANDTDADGDAVTLESVTPGALGTTEIVGDSIVYTPGPGFAGSDEFTYAIGDGRDGAATGRVRISYPYPAAAGTYRPMVLGADGAPAGTMSVTLLPTGGFTIGLTLRGVAYVGKGTFDADGNAQVVLKVKGRSVTITLRLDLSDPSYPLTGSIDSAGVVDQLLPGVAAANAKVLLPKALRFTMSLHAPATEPAAHGYAVVTVSRASATRIAGQLADGTPFTVATVRLQDGSVKWTVPVRKNAGWLLGDWALQESDTALPGGTTQWLRTATSTLTGFLRLLPTIGSAYVAPTVAAVSAIDFPDSTARQASFSLRNGGLPEELDYALSFLKSDVIQTPVGSTLALHFDRPSGFWSGTVTLGGAKRSIRGVFLQSQNQGFGYFLNGLEAGSAELVPQ